MKYFGNFKARKKHSKLILPIVVKPNAVTINPAVSIISENIIMRLGGNYFGKKASFANNQLIYHF